jgi:hypothetical protein
MIYKSIYRGEIGLVEDFPLRMDLSTCVGTIIYGENIVGISHGFIPEITPTFHKESISTGIEDLLSLITSKGGTDLRAILLGGRGNEPLGIANASEARETLRAINIPVMMDIANSYIDQIVKVYREKFEVSAPNHTHILSIPFKRL